MSADSEVHNDGQNIILLPPLTITTAIGATATTPITKLTGLGAIVAEAKFVYGSGGTNVTAYVQTSLDGGLTWIDVICMQFTTASASKIASASIYQLFAVSPFVPLAPNDAALAANTCVQGILGDRLRLKYVTTGTYGGATTLAVYVIAKS